MGTKYNTIENVDIAAFVTSMGNGSAIKPLRELTCEITPTQSLNGYTKPWPGGAGKNLLRPPSTGATIKGITWTVNEDGTVTADGTATADSTFYYFGADSVYVDPLIAPGSYKANGAPTGVRLILKAKDNSSAVYVTNNQDVDITIEDDTYRILLRVTSGTTVDNLVCSPMIRVNTEADSNYEPYENICPITGQTSVSVRTAGKNLLAPATPGTTVRYGVTVENRTDGSVSFSGSATQAVSFEFSQAVMPPGTYKYTAKGSTTGSEGNATLYLRNLDTASTIISMGLSAAQTETRTFTLSKPTLVRHYIVVQNGVTVSGDLYPMILLDGESNDDYEPYKGQVATVQLGQEVYGGTIDVVSGTLTIDRVLFSPTAVVSVSLNDSTGLYTWRFNIQDNPAPDNNRGELISNYFRNTNGSVIIGGAYLTNYGRTIICVPGDQSLNTKALADAWVAEHSVQFVYLLATPQTVQLTGRQINTLMGQNNVWASTGAIKKLVWVSMTYDLLQVFINGVDITELIAFNGWERQRNDVDSPDAGRTLDGRMHRARVATKMRFNVTCRPLLSGEISTLESLIMPEYVTVKVIGDPYFGTWEKLCYVNNTSAKYLIRKKDGRQYWGGITFPIIEV